MERLIARIAPQWALRRATARARLSLVERLYKAAEPSNLRNNPPASVSGNAVVDAARGKLRDWARHLDENHDVSHRALTILARQAANQQLVPTIRNRAGEPIEKLNRDVAEEWERWCEGADFTGGQPWEPYCRLVARSLFRDGECFVIHDTANGYRLRTYEADYVPFDLMPDASARVVHGVELDDEDQPVRYWFHRSHPEDLEARALLTGGALLGLPADIVSHLRLVTRIGQVRGVSVMAPALPRLGDVSEYEGSENAAAKVASAIAVQITRGPQFADAAVGTVSQMRELELQPGMILDNLAPGEKYEVIDTSRPNPELNNYRRGQLRAVAAGMGVAYSSMTRDYDGSYSSQRQELVEARADYADIQRLWRASFLRPVYARFMGELVRTAAARGLTGFGRADPATLIEFDTVPPEAPWIDPAKEAAADKLAIEMGIESRAGVMRLRGKDPRRVDQEREADQLAGVAPVNLGGMNEQQTAASESSQQDGDTEE